MVNKLALACGLAIYCVASRLACSLKWDLHSGILTRGQGKTHEKQKIGTVNYIAR